MTPRRLILPVLALGAVLAACQPRAENRGGEPSAAPAETAAPAPQAAAPAPTPTPAPEPEAERIACRDEIGETAAQALVQRCIQVSPATHPPCNVANPCELIQGEIDRSCALWTRDGETPPKACAA